MEDGARKLVLQVLIAAVATLAISAPVTAQADAASGQLRINGTGFTLRHVYVSTQPGFFDRTTEDIRLLFTDVALEEADRRDAFAPARLARTGKLHGVEVIVDPRGEPLTGALFVQAFNGMASVSGMHQFASRQMGSNRIAGRLFTDGPRTFAGITYEYEVTFAAAIPRQPTAAETAASLASPPAEAVTAHLAAMRQGLDAFISTLTSGSAATYKGADALARLAALVRETPPDSRVVSLLQKDATAATATVQGHRRQIVIEFTLQLTLEGGRWKVIEDQTRPPHQPAFDISSVLPEDLYRIHAGRAPRRNGRRDRRGGEQDEGGQGEQHRIGR